MTQLLLRIFSSKNPSLDLSPFDPTRTQNHVCRALFGSTSDGEKGWGLGFPQAFFRKSFACHVKASRFLSRPIPLFINFLRRDGLVGKGMLVAWQVACSFVAWEIGL